ncbi:hypothetical protein OG709_04765 [Streptomyces sp. NBC_01267]|uniref:hypothetical protein n=1 Tax=unclassified Streptomyces TaxID=2593676 RepID=UPI00224FC0B7|nr:MULTISPECIES: hypothetical protein [unclassified Streptomyces]MCX4552359.1 hypothetical protein [Streptomyces sp. NBC_01500]
MAQSNQSSSMRRALRREAPSTVGLLADERDFASMRRYRSFTFDDHTTYLQQIEGLLRALTEEGVHTTVALFDPEEFAEFCEAAGLDPDSADSRTRFTAGIVSAGAALPYAGQPIDRLVPLLIDEAVRQATWEYATMVLAERGECADCGQDIGRASFDRASRALKSLLDSAGSGSHHLVCSVPAEGEPLLAVLHAESQEGAVARLDHTEGAAFVTVLAAGIALESPGGVVIRTTASGQDDKVRGWRLQRGHLVPLTAGEVFTAYCTDAETGDPVSPESGVDYCAGYALPQEDTHH